MLQSRTQKGWSVRPLKNRKTYAKRGGGGAESKEGVLPVIQKRLKKEANGSPAFQAAASDLQKTNLKGVSNLKTFLLYTGCQSPERGDQSD